MEASPPRLRPPAGLGSVGARSCQSGGRPRVRLRRDGAGDARPAGRAARQLRRRGMGHGRLRQRRADAGSQRNAAGCEDDGAGVGGGGHADGRRARCRRFSDCARLLAAGTAPLRLGLVFELRLERPALGCPGRVRPRRCPRMALPTPGQRQVAGHGDHRWSLSRFQFRLRALLAPLRRADRPLVRHEWPRSLPGAADRCRHLLDGILRFSPRDCPHGRKTATDLSQCVRHGVGGLRGLGRRGRLGPAPRRRLRQHDAGSGTRPDREPAAADHFAPGPGSGHPSRAASSAQPRHRHRRQPAPSVNSGTPLRHPPRPDPPCAVADWRFDHG